MNIQFPEAQFAKVFPKPIIGGWKRMFHRHVTQGVILHDRFKVAVEEPSKKNAKRLALSCLKLGTHLGYTDSQTHKWITSKAFPSNWDELVSAEVNRILDIDKQ